MVESLVENPGFRPGSRPAWPGLRPAHNNLRTFRVENLVESVLDLSQHVVIDLARFRPNTHVTCDVNNVTSDVSNVQSLNGFATCFRLVCNPFAHLTQVRPVFDLLDSWNLALTRVYCQATLLWWLDAMNVDVKDVLPTSPPINIYHCSQ